MQQRKETLRVTSPPSLPCSMAWGEHRWHSVALFWPWLRYTLAQPQSLGTSSAKGGPEALPKTPFLLLPPQSMEPRAILKRQGMKTQWACDPGKHDPGYKRSKHSKMSVILMSDRKPILSFKYILREVEQKFSFHPLHLQGLNQIWWPDNHSPFDTFSRSLPGMTKLSTATINLHGKVVYIREIIFQLAENFLAQ